MDHSQQIIIDKIISSGFALIRDIASRELHCSQNAQSVFNIAEVFHNLTPTLCGSRWDANRFRLELIMAMSRMSSPNDKARIVRILQKYDEFETTEG